MSGKDMVLSGEKLKFNLKTQKGELVDTYGLISPFVRYETDRLDQIDRETLTFKRLDFSSCAQIFPRWNITGRKGRIKKEKYIEMQQCAAAHQEHPGFLLAVLALSDARRTAGPRVFCSRARQFHRCAVFLVQNSFFWAIRPNIDMTFGLRTISPSWGSASAMSSATCSAMPAAVPVFIISSTAKDNGVYDEIPTAIIIVEAEHRQNLLS